MDVLYISDMDGTLLAQEGALSRRSAQWLKEMLEKGLAFTVATARSNVSALPILRELPLRLPLILMNGAILFDPVENRPIHIEVMPPQMAGDCIETIKEAGLTPLLYTHDEKGDQRIYYQALDQDAQRAHVQTRLDAGDTRFRKVGEFAERLHEQCFYVTTMGTREQLLPITQELVRKGITYHNYYDVYTKGYFLECCPPGINKGTAIAALRRMLSPGKVVAFGDNHNDVAMFNAADESCAVANAQPELFSIATRKIAANDQDGVVRFIREDWGMG